MTFASLLFHLQFISFFLRRVCWCTLFLRASFACSSLCYTHFWTLFFLFCSIDSSHKSFQTSPKLSLAPQTSRDLLRLIPLVCFSFLLFLCLLIALFLLTCYAVHQSGHFNRPLLSRYPSPKSFASSLSAFPSLATIRVLHCTSCPSPIRMYGRIKTASSKKSRSLLGG